MFRLGRKKLNALLHFPLCHTRIVFNPLAAPAKLNRLIKRDVRELLLRQKRNRNPIPLLFEQNPQITFALEHPDQNGFLLHQTIVPQVGTGLKKDCLYKTGPCSTMKTGYVGQ